MSAAAGYRYLPPRLHTDKVVSDDTLWRLWRQQRLDTYAIASQVGIPEHEVANRLPRIREQMRTEAEWNFDALNR